MLPTHQKKYLQRIQYLGSLTPTYDVLCQLQKSHLLHIPFENLDIHYNNKIELDIKKLFAKVMLRNRGGFCYELNGLFFELLQSIGFQVKRISANVFDQEKGYGKEFDHLTLIVKIDTTEYLTDVGFGEFTFGPLRIELDTIQKDERGDFYLDKLDEKNFRVNKLTNGKPIPQYIFTTKERTYSEFEPMCNYHQYDSDSHFTHKKVISRPLKDGRITLNDFLLKIKKGDQLEETKLKDKTEFERELWNHFSIKI